MSEFTDTIQGIVETPASEHIFTVREDADSKLLDEDQDTEFHHSVAQLLFATPRISKYIQTYVAFLTTRVSISDNYDWCKLR